MAEAAVQQMTPRTRSERREPAEAGERVAPTGAEAIATSIKGTVDRVTALACDRIGDARKQLDALEQTQIENGARAKTILDEMVKASDESQRVIMQMTELAQDQRARLARLVDARVEDQA